MSAGSRPDPSMSGIARRHVVASASAALLAMPLAAAAQERLWRVGVLAISEATWMLDILRDVFRAQGYVEGRNFVLEKRYGGADAARLRDLTTELVAAGCDVIWASGGTAARAARAATATVPIVVTFGGDPVGAGLAASLARPGGNVTGVTTQQADLIGKRLQLFMEVFGAGWRVGVIHGMGVDVGLQLTEGLARQLGLALVLRGVSRAEDYEPALQSLALEERVVVVPMPSSLLLRHAGAVGAASRRLRLPAIFDYREAVLAGGLMSYGADVTLVARRAAEYVARVLKGDKPGELPFQQLDRLELVVNLRTARELTLSLPLPVIGRADEVIE